jgi:hypothetical protein
MATTIVPPTINDETSFADLRALIGGESTPAPVKDPEPKQTTSEPAAGDPPAEENHEPATEPGKEKTEPKESDEEDLPEGVKKRIAKEVEKTTRAQAAIDRAVSERKAKEAEAAKLTTDGKGSEPVKTPQPSTSEKPKRPVLSEPGHENETYADFVAREAKYNDELLPAWIKAEAKREFEQETTEREAKKTREQRWNEAVTKHGKDFPSQVEAVRAVAPEGLQVAISALDNWSGVAAHLGKNPGKLQELATLYAQNPTRAIATLGRIEAALTTDPKPATPPAKEEKPLPEPIAKVGGSASASGQDFADMAQNGSFTQLKTAVGKLRAKK